MLRSLVFFILTLLAVDLSPSIPNNEGIATLLIAAIPLLLAASNQKKIFQRPLRDTILFSELFLFTLLFFYGVGIPHTVFSISSYLTLYFLAVGIGISWNLALFLIPFALPFLLFTAASHWLVPLIGKEAFLGVSFLLAAAIILLLPLAFQWASRCQPLPYSPLRDRLDFLCKQHGFHHGGLLVWNVMHGSATAAIIGVFPRFRYVLFTEKLLRAFPAEEVEAVLAHEMGHAFHKHLLLYPLLLLGFPTIAALLAPWLERIPPILTYLSYALIFILYIRVVVGFFSRNFERQADLHVFAVGISGETLTTALNRISYLNSLPLKKKNWHHGSLDDRISFLKQAEADHRLIGKHHRKVRYYLIIYLLINLSFLICWKLLN
ncbi:MAG: M48 family metalloprotease [Chlamydiales bacterium]|nr:M48 family metalloprotease [Chlamydiales bacterium]